jgi:signal transduction histidine kinase
MPDDEREANPERDQTDESLRAERALADDVIGQEISTDEAADAVIERARARADAVLLAARKKSDQESATRKPSVESVGAVERKRELEDQTLRRERAVADDLVDVERAQHAVILASEREATDDDLSRERARADDAVATRDEFLGVVSHDLRNMLGSIVGLAAMIVVAESKEDHGDQVRAHAHRISRSVARMNRLIGDLVDVASIEAGSLAVTREIEDPTPTVMEAVDAFRVKASESGIALTVEVVPPPTLLSFDSARLLQVLTNLLSNAVKFTPAGGSVVVRTERTGDDILFTVSDTGVGIPAEYLEAVFERFLQLNNDRRGVGLGLYISKSIVQGHGGRIWAERRDGGGSTFRFTLPIGGGRPVTL